MKNSMKKLVVVVLTLVVACANIIATPITAKASVTYENGTNSDNFPHHYKVGKTYKDVKKSTKYSKAITYAANKGYAQIFAKKGKKFQPTKLVTRREVGRVLDKAFGNRINIVIKNPSKRASVEWSCELMNQVSEQLGCKMNWSWKDSEKNLVISRGLLMYYIYEGTKYSDALIPNPIG